MWKLFQEWSLYAQTLGDGIGIGIGIDAWSAIPISTAIPTPTPNVFMRHRVRHRRMKICSENILGARASRAQWF